MNLHKKHSNINAKIRKYCVLAERCEKQVRIKLESLGIIGNDADIECEKLRVEKYFNDERFARIKVLNYSMNKKWGVNKIILFLKSMEIPETIIKKIIKEINPNTKLEQLRKIIKDELLMKTHPMTLFQKCTRAGFEEEAIRSILTEEGVL